MPFHGAPPGFSEFHSHFTDRANAPGNPSGKKPVEMRRVGDTTWRWFSSQTDAAKAFGLSKPDVSMLINNASRALQPKEACLRERFEARPARGPRKRALPTKGKADRAPPKKPHFAGKRVEGAKQKANGKWHSEMFPGRDFDDLDAYRAAKKQRYARKDEYRVKNIRQR